MKWMRNALLLALVPVCFIAGITGGPWLRQTYVAVFPPPQFQEGDFQSLYVRAGKPVVMFSTTTCPYCKKARELFAAEGVAYTDFVIDKSAAAHAEFQQRGGRSVPLIYIGNREIKGFREQVLRDSVALLRKGE
jgi:glutaredoxin